MEQTNQYCQILTVKSFTPIYKGDEEASNIHVINFEENDFVVVSQKSLYNVGDKAMYIFPDTNLPMAKNLGDYSKPHIALFAEYFAPGGNPNKCRLGIDNNKNKTRVRDVKFGWKYADGRSVFSKGILIPLSELPKQKEGENWDTTLGLYKEDKEVTVKGQVQTKGTLPDFIRKSDETHFEKNSHSLTFPIDLIITKKNDGSSSTPFQLNEERNGICQRSLEKKIDHVEKIYEGYRFKYDKENDRMAYFNTDTKEFVSTEDFAALNVPFVEKTFEDNYTITGKPILNVLKQRKLNLAIRMEIFGNGINDSSVNRDAKLPLSYAVYGIDDLSTGSSERIPQAAAMQLAYELGFNTAEIYCRGVFNSKQELIDKVNEIFDAQEHPIEGVVIRSALDNSYSGKYLNSVYDEKK